MTNYQALYSQLISRMNARPIGTFKITDLINNPPGKLGVMLYTDVVKRKKYSNIRYKGKDVNNVNIYEKF